MADKVVMTAAEMDRALSRMASEIIETNKGVKDVILIGIINRGASLAERLAKMISKIEKTQVPFGAIDVSMYRDDLAEKGGEIEVKKSEIPMSIDGKIVVLVDDVIFAGRTVRAAMDGLNDYGRPAKIQLAALIDRGHRELPIHPDFVGKQMPTPKSEKVMVNLAEVDGADRVVVQ